MRTADCRQIGRVDADDALAEFEFLCTQGTIDDRTRGLLARMFREVRLQRSVTRLLVAGATEKAVKAYVAAFFETFDRAAHQLEAEQARQLNNVIDMALAR